MNIKDEIFEAYGEMKAEQDLLAVGYTALLGTSMAAKSGEAALLNRFSARYVRECQNLYEKWNPSPLLEAFAAHKGLESADPSRLHLRGIRRAGAASWQRCGIFLIGFGLGFEMDLRKLPIRQETVEVCEVFDLNPYRLQSQGCILLTASSGPKLLKNLEREGIPAALIGRTRTAIGREIYSGEVHSFLDRPKPDEIDKMKDLQKSH